MKEAARAIFQERILPIASSKLKGIIRCFGKYASLISGGKLLEKINTSAMRPCGYWAHSGDVKPFPDAANDYKRCLILDMYINVVDYKYCSTY